MLTPSYSELMTKVNETNDVDSKVTSRYTIVIAAAKRARQLIDGAEPLIDSRFSKPVSVAVTEMEKGKIKIVDKSDGDDDYYRAIRDQMMMDEDEATGSYN